MNPIGPFPGSSPSYSSQVVSWGWHFPCHLGHQCTCFLGALSPTVRMITLNKTPHSTMDNLNIIFTSCCVGSSLCQPDRMRTRVYLYDLWLLLTHPCHWTHVDKSASNTLPSRNTFHAAVMEGSRGRGNLRLYSSWQLNTSVTLSKALFLFFASWGFLIQFLSQEHFLPQLFTKGLYGDGDHMLYFYFPRRISFLHPFP